MSKHIGNDYTQAVFQPESFKGLVKDYIKKLRLLQKELKFNALAGCGHSGVPLTAAVSYATGIPFFAVRKQNDSHGGSMVDGFTPSNHCRYLIIDDFIETGSTIKKIVRTMNREFDSHCLPKPEPVAVLLYDAEHEHEGIKYGKLHIPVLFI